MQIQLLQLQLNYLKNCQIQWEKPAILRIFGPLNELYLNGKLNYLKNGEIWWKKFEIAEIFGPVQMKFDDFDEFKSNWKQNHRKMVKFGGKTIDIADIWSAK